MLSVIMKFCSAAEMSWPTNSPDVRKHVCLMQTLDFNISFSENENCDAKKRSFPLIMNQIAIIMSVFVFVFTILCSLHQFCINVMKCFDFSEMYFAGSVKKRCSLLIILSINNFSIDFP